VRTIVVCALLVVLAAGCGDNGEQAQTEDTIVYVALGDSIARGALLGGRGRGSPCGPRTPLLFALSAADTPNVAYPALLEADLHELSGREVAFANLACSGLKVQQLAAARPTLLARAIAMKPDVVTVLIGANDIVLPCIPAKLIFTVRHTLPESRVLLPQRLENCDVENGFAAIEQYLPQVLARLRNETTAEVFVGTYYSGTGSPAENDVARRLNDAIANATAAAGPRFHLVSGVAAAFRAHDCRARSDRWLLGWDLCLHPNRAGQRAIADRFLAVMKPFAGGF
jgi:lysophospholipase L1-like esterase